MLVPAQPSDTEEWVFQHLQAATKRLAEPALAAAIAQDLTELLNNMKPGAEAAHLREMVRRVDHRGSDATLFAR